MFLIFLWRSRTECKYVFCAASTARKRPTNRIVLSSKPSDRTRMQRDRDHSATYVLVPLLLRKSVPFTSANCVTYPVVLQRIPERHSWPQFRSAWSCCTLHRKRYVLVYVFRKRVPTLLRVPIIKLHLEKRVLFLWVHTTDWQTQGKTAIKYRTVDWNEKPSFPQGDSCSMCEECHNYWRH